MKTEKTEGLAFNPVTGMHDLPGAATPAGPVVPRVSFVQSDKGTEEVPVETATVRLCGFEVGIREMDPTEKAQYEADQLAAEQQLAAVKTGEEWTDAQANQQAVWNAALNKHVVRWKLTLSNGSPLPCNEATKQDMWPSHKSELCDLILQRSSVGRDQSGFLPPVSTPG